MDAALSQSVTASFARRRRVALAIPALIVLYLICTFFAFDIPGIASRARLDNAKVLLSDFWSYKTQVTRDNRTGEVVVSIEGDAKSEFSPDEIPAWVTDKAGITTIDLGSGNIVTYNATGATYDVPGYGVIAIEPRDGKLVLTAPQPIPKWISVSDNRVGVTTAAGRFTYTRSKVETFRYFAGWELFFFTLDSPFYGKNPLQVAETVLFADRIDAARSNLALMASNVWNNRLWHHGDVIWALFETILMAFLGTLSAALIALPVSFVAASNFMPIRAARFGIRRVFDFIRGVDGLIWTIILSRAFGPGPMTGALAILLTDTGSFGKLFSESLENIDEKQVEGLRSTGANALQRARFGVMPQVMPVLISQVLYNLESNTRSATVIGAIVGGGIGLLLTQAIQTQKDWEDVAYYMILIVLMVMIMDSLSGWIRRRLIRG